MDASETFLTEAEEHLEALELGLVGLEHADSDVIDSVFRAAHSIKGGAATCGFGELARFTHHVENVLDAVRDGSLRVVPRLQGALLQSLDVIEAFIQRLREGDDSVPDVAAAVLQALRECASEPQAAVTAGAGRTWTIRILPKPDMLIGNDPMMIFGLLKDMGRLEVVASTEALPTFAELVPDELHLRFELTLTTETSREEIEETLSWMDDDAKWTLEAEEPSGLEPLSQSTERTEVTVFDEATGRASKKKEKRRSLRVSASKVDAVLNQLGELVITGSTLRMVLDRLDDDSRREVQSVADSIDRQMRAVQERVLEMRMVPIATVFNKLPRVVFDACRVLGKEVDFQVEGEWTEIDREVVEVLSDPLVHMVRNAVDHGMESPDDREAVGKARRGTVVVSAEHTRGSVVVRVRDDGRGINLDRLREKAVEKGLVSEAEAHRVDENILFEPGFSTASQVTDLSGRGVGLDVVRKNMEAIGGTVAVRSPGVGTIFELSVPLTLAILDGQLVQVGAETYVIPIRSIVELLRPEPERFQCVAGSGWLYRGRGGVMPVVSVGEVFGLPDTPETPRGQYLVVVEVGARWTALAVDGFHRQQQVVLKSLDRHFCNAPGLSGATILGDGRVAMVIEPAAIAEHARAA